MRSSEMILTKAEAEARAGQDENAQNTLYILAHGKGCCICEVNQHRRCIVERDPAAAQDRALGRVRVRVLRITNVGG